MIKSSLIYNFQLEDRIEEKFSWLVKSKIWDEEKGWKAGTKNVQIKKAKVF